MNPRNRGFTMLEMMITLILMGTAALLLPRLSSSMFLSAPPEGLPVLYRKQRKAAAHAVAQLSARARERE